ncbi:hypothetical protein MMC20_000302 [Loxospora ochrophaea]|nr:hypothetical protein [Loxospora ochrophaea]
MAPTSTAPSNSSPSSATIAQLHLQWHSPHDFLTLLLLVGGDVIQCALAQQTGSALPTPVVFSFGWVAYAFTALLSSLGENKLMPQDPDLPSIVFSTDHGHVRPNRSWILGRILRDFDKCWMPAEVRRKFEAMLRKVRKNRAGLCVSVFEAIGEKEAGVPVRDAYWLSGYAVAVVQLCIATIPWAKRGVWEIFAITMGGTVLAFVTGSLPQWRRERWSCRRNSRKTFVLLKGNGAQHALVVRGVGKGLDLEDLANWGEGNEASLATKLAVWGLTICWTVLLITVSGMQNETWFLVLVGALGMIHTLMIAGAPRRPETFGIHLRYCEAFVDPKVMEALKSVEKTFPGVGRSMLPVFFPGTLLQEDIVWWEEGQVKEQEIKSSLEKKPESVVEKQENSGGSGREVSGGR